MVDAKRQIIKVFEDNVLGKVPNVDTENPRHCGKEGHWLERAMGINPNGNNTADIHGYEMKNHTSGKTSFGDWSANWYIYKHKGNPHSIITRDRFLQIFGKKNAQKKGRFSWSGEPCPNISGYNRFGQKLLVDKEQNIIVLYSYSKDERKDKKTIVPTEFQVDKLTLARWNKESIQLKLEKKFNQKGWFKCLRNNEGIYDSICFGAPINYEQWINLVKSGDVFFDSGMYQGNPRPYSMWRANNRLWDLLVIEEHCYFNDG